MINRLFLVLLMILPNSSFAMEIIEADESTNFCLDKQTSIDNYAIAVRNSDDQRIIKLVALRTGLCDLLEKKVIELKFAKELFEQVQNDSIQDQIENNLQDDQSDEVRLIEI